MYEMYEKTFQVHKHNRTGAISSVHSCIDYTDINNSDSDNNDLKNIIIEDLKDYIRNDSRTGIINDLKIEIIKKLKAEIIKAIKTDL